MNELISSEQDRYWLGLDYQEQPYMWVWSTTGESIDYYQNWQPGQPNDVTPANGAVLENGQWVIVDKQEEYYAICKMDQGKTCPKDWNLNNDKCYQWFTSPHMRRNWDSGRMYCESIGANIIKIESQEEQNYISSFNHELAVSGVSTYWIGASNINHREYFAWVDGSSLDYFNNFPDSKVPDPYEGWDECVAGSVVGNKQNWDGYNCGDSKSFICEVPIGSPVKEPVNEDYKCDENFHYFDQSKMCYHTSSRPYVWSGASRYCSNLGATLATINNADENAFIGELIHLETLIGDSDFWIGLKCSKGAKDRFQNNIMISDSSAN